MSFDLPSTVERASGSFFLPTVTRVAGEDRRDLASVLDLNRPATYIALFQLKAGVFDFYVGHAGCGQQRPAMGPHLELAEQILVITDAAGNLTVADAEVVERSIWATLRGLGYSVRGYIPNAGRVGQQRYDLLQLFSASSLIAIKANGWLFGEVSSTRLITTPNQSGATFYNLGLGHPVGEEVTLDKVGVHAKGVRLPSGEFVLFADSEIRKVTVPSAGNLLGAMREELFHSGWLKPTSCAHYILRRPLLFASPTAAAQFVTGSTSTASDWEPFNPGPRFRLV
jgi:hypothetical protein